MLSLNRARFLSLAVVFLLLLMVLQKSPRITALPFVNEPYLVRDISSDSTYFTDFSVLNDVLYFGITMVESALWRSDGTYEGTYRVKEFDGWSGPQYLMEINGQIYFVIDQNSLWRSDGTENGTIKIKEFDQGGVQFLTDADNLLFFAANSGDLGQELWISDGTEDGTILVKDIYPGAGSSKPYKLLNADGIVYFIANDGIHGDELWKSDGTELGTVLVKDINLGLDPGLHFDYACMLYANGILYFGGYDETHGDELWKSDGTEAGTVLIKDINPNEDSSFGGTCPMTFYNGLLYFFATDGSIGDAHGNELWRSDGTESGTYIVKDIRDGLMGSVSSTISHKTFAQMGEKLFFMANDGEYGIELWASDGTGNGTYMVKDINPGIYHSIEYGFELFSHNSPLYFGANDGEHGTELWTSNGDEAGTIMLGDNYPVDSGWGIENFVRMNDLVFFTAYEEVHGRELWAISIKEEKYFNYLPFIVK